jgi:hypothetical protein
VSRKLPLSPRYSAWTCGGATAGAVGQAGGGHDPSRDAPSRAVAAPPAGGRSRSPG